MREPGPELNPKVQVEALVAALLEPLGRKTRQELLKLLHGKCCLADGLEPVQVLAGVEGSRTTLKEVLG